MNIRIQSRHLLGSRLTFPLHREASYPGLADLFKVCYVGQRDSTEGNVLDLHKAGLVQPITLCPLDQSLSTAPVVSLEHCQV